MGGKKGRKKQSSPPPQPAPQAVTRADGGNDGTAPAVALPGWVGSLPTFFAARRKLAGAAVCALVAAVVFCVYANTLSAPFLLDDANVITRERLFRELSLHNAYRIVTEHRLRPLANLLFYLNYHLQGTPAYPVSTGPWAGTYGPNGTYHAINMILHCVNGLLLFALLKALLEQRAPGRDDGAAPLAGWIALGATLLWLVHPIQTMAVTYIVQRYALLAALGILGSLLCYVSFRRRMEAGTVGTGARAAGTYALVAGVPFFQVVGVLSKENAAIVPVLMVAIEWLCFSRTVPDGDRHVLDRVLGRRRGRWVAAFMLAPFFLLALLYRHVKVGLGDLLPSSAFPFPDRMSYFRTEWVVTLKYVKLWAWPFDLTIEHAFPRLDWSNPQHGVPLVTALVGHALILCLGAIWYRRGARFLTLCVVWYYATLAVESSFVPIQDPMVEHRMYVPSAMLAAGLAYVVVVGAANAWQWGRRMLATTLAGAFLLLVTFMGIGAHVRNRAWGTPQDSMAIWRDAVEKRPDCARAYGSLGQESIFHGRYADAVAAVGAALDLGPNADRWNNLGKAYLELGSLVPSREVPHEPWRSSLEPCPIFVWARDAIQRAIEVHRILPTARIAQCWSNLGVTYMRMAGRVPADAPGQSVRQDERLRLLAEASRALAEAVKLDSGFDLAWLDLGRSYVQRCQLMPRGHERHALALLALQALSSAGATGSPNHPLFRETALELARADRHADHHADALQELDALYGTAPGAGARGRVAEDLAMYAEEARKTCDELRLLPDALAQQRETLALLPGAAENRGSFTESIAEIQRELDLARSLRETRFGPIADVLVHEAGNAKADPRAYADLVHGAAKLTWFAGAEPDRAWRLYDAAISALPAGEERERIEQEKSILMSEPSPPP